MWCVKGCWLYWNETQNQTHVVCKMVLTCWLWRTSLYFPSIWCVKNCWLADFASTDKFSEPCGVWKAADLLTALKQNKKINTYGVQNGADLLTLNKESKFSNHMVCEKLLTCWHWCLEEKKSNTCGVWNGADLLTLNKEPNFSNHVVCERLLTCWLYWNKTKNQTHVVCGMVLTCWL